MAYVRRRGNQLAVVHGTRNKETGKVEQRILFAVYSKAEARQILGRDGREMEAEEFKRLMRRRYPDILFNWRKIGAGIEENLEALPDQYEYREKRLLTGFRDDLRSFVRRLVEAEPALASGEPLHEYKRELRFLRALLDQRLASLAGKDGRETKSRFYWHETLTRPTVYGDVEEVGVRFMDHGDLESAQAAFQLLLECYPEYTSSHVHLGRIALAQGKHSLARQHYEQADHTARENLRRRKVRAPAPVWDEDQLALIEATSEQALLHACLGQYDEALALADRLEIELEAPTHADEVRAGVYLNRGNWGQAAEAALRFAQEHPEWRSAAAFAVHETGDRFLAASLFLRGLMYRPEFAATMLGQDPGKGGLPSAPRLMARAALVAHRLRPFFTGWPSESKGHFDGLYSFAVKKGALAKLFIALHSALHAGGREQNRATMELRWLRSESFADQMAKEFLGTAACATPHSVDEKSPQVEEPPELEYCYVDSPPLRLVAPLGERDERTPVSVLPDAMNVHATLLPRSLLEYWLRGAGVTEAFISKEALEAMPEEIPALVFKGSAAAARGCNRLLRGVDGIAMQDGSDAHTDVVALADGQVRGLLARVVVDDVARANLAHVTAAAGRWGGRLLLAYSAGGTRQQRDHVRVWDLVGAREVGLVTAREPTVASGAQEGESLWHLYGTFDVELKEAEPRVWRRFQLRLTGSTFEDLHDAIQAACGWENRHLFEFHWGKRTGDQPIADSGFESTDADPPPAHSLSLSEVLRPPAPVTFCYTYDFGDDWEHRVTLVDIVELPERFQRRLLDGDRSFPPEDCGSLPGYYKCVELAAGAYSHAEVAADAELRALRKWLGEWKPDDFSLEKARKSFDA